MNRQMSRLSQTPTAKSSKIEITRLLIAWGNGDESALEKLIPVVYEELRRIAHHHMRNEKFDHTLQTTALVNEAYLRLVGMDDVRWQDRVHFFAISSRLMRRILVDFARSRQFQKRGGKVQHVSFDETLIAIPEKELDLVKLDDALSLLSEEDERKSKVVEMRFFGGMSVEETAEALGVSSVTVMRDWKFAKFWLLNQMIVLPFFNRHALAMILCSRT
jgi:RNA polymerase sigma factor (TIGR02999 family)